MKNTKKNTEAAARFAALPMEAARAFYAFAKSPEQVKAEALNAQSRKAARLAEKAEAAARAAVVRVDRLTADPEAANIDPAATEKAKAEAAKKTEAATIARALAADLERQAAEAAADPAAIIAAYHIDGATIAATRADYEAAARFTTKAAEAAKAKAARALAVFAALSKSAKKARAEATAAALDFAKTPTADRADLARKAARLARVAESEAEAARADYEAAKREAAEKAAAKVKTPTDPAALARVAALAAFNRADLFRVAFLTVFPDLDPTPTAKAAEAAKAEAEAARAAFLAADTDENRAATFDRYHEAQKEAAKAAALNEARAAFIGYEAAEMVARQSAKKRADTEATPLAFAIKAAAEARDHAAPDLADLESAARVPLCAIAYGSEAEAAKAEAEAERIQAAEAEKPRKDRNGNEAREAARLLEAAAAIREKEADPAAPFWILSARRVSFRSLNDYYFALRSVRENESPEAVDFDLLTDPATDPESPENTEAAKARRAAILSAFERLTAILTPTRRAIFADMVKGYTVAQITARRGYVNHAPACRHIDKIKATAAALLTEAAPDLAEAVKAAALLSGSRPAAIIAAEAEAAKAEATRPTLQGRKAAAADFSDLCRAEAVKAATAATLAALTPTRRRLLFALREAGSIRAAAAALNKNEATAREHIKATRAAFIAALLNISTAESMEAVKARAAVPDLKERAEAAKIEAVKAAKDKTPEAKAAADFAAKCKAEAEAAEAKAAAAVYSANTTAEAAEAVKRADFVAIAALLCGLIER